MKYRKRPVVIEVEAIQWTGKNHEDIIEFLDLRPDVLEVRFRGGILHIVKEKELLVTQPGKFIVWENGNTDTCFADDFERDFERVTK
ncbi:hypothetical protein BA81_14167 [Bacillus safensis FO-36b]|uniref:hypothetical protein n=1 Tax=Bacillus safensis TaxID=561879 RepID=UPI00045C5A66|nr:hypothetical protein [Bacillus safensis]AWI35721.1 hypothetical protein RS87_03095 [Bacillus safensis FO-36b]KDE26699.1 hypothetical protein BA81_14167 [Bacillus safensis FO-36b]MCM3050270.1 hypothetical protein [Bacillus safensis]MEC1048600.1 hypothetical protein [Bacillus safensis]